MNVRVALVQFKVNADPIEENLSRMERYVKQASGSADVIVFPEYALTGGGEDVIDDGTLLERFRTLAQRFAIDLVPGTILERRDTVVVNTAYYLDADGTIKGRYEKINLWHSENGGVEPGGGVSVFETRFGRAGLAVCWDLIRSDLFAQMARAGARIVYCPSLWFSGADMTVHAGRPDTQKHHLDALTRARAIENAIALVFVNGVGRVKLTDRYDPGVGQSRITLPVIGAVGSMDEEEGMRIATIDLSILDAVREAYGL